MNKPSDLECLEICRLCINFLYESTTLNNYAEKTLFRSCVSQTDVRILQKQIIELNINNKNYSGNGKIRDDIDPHLAAEVLLTTLKDMTYPLLYEVYDIIVSIDISEEDFNMNKRNIQNWISKLTENSFNLSSSLFRLLNRLSQLEDSDSCLLQLSFSISPVICRPMTSAYMSIKHTDDLRKIRPVISFLIENYVELFTSDMKPSIQSNIKYNKNQNNNSNNDKNKTINITVENNSNISNNINIVKGTKNFSPKIIISDDASPDTMHTPVKNNNNHNNLSIRTEIGLSNMNSDNNNDYNHIEINNNQNGSIQLISYNEAELKILEAIIFAKVSNFIDFEDDHHKRKTQSHSIQTPPHQKTRPSASSFSDDSENKNQFNKVNSFSISNYSNSNNTSLSLSPKSPNNNNNNNNNNNRSSMDIISNRKSTGLTNNNNNNNNSVISSGRMKRRKMVMECKSLRTQIFEFEQDWMKKYNKIPKGSERGSMLPIYSRYRDLKKEIRDLAATDLQRLIRGYNVRKYLSKSFSLKGNKLFSDNNNNNNNMMVSKSLNSLNIPLHNNKKTNSTNIPLELYSKYKDLLYSKKDLKRKLKKFDEEFTEQWGRTPKKTDKEAIRPMYQKYHEIKNSLDDLRVVIETNHGPLPEELLEETPNGRNGTPTRPSSMDKDPFLIRGATSKSLISSLSDDENNNDNLDGLSGSVADDSKMSEVVGNIEALQLEKKNLHAFLKIYERDFNRQNGRAVMRQEDIQPVASEYQRYKELKQAIKEKKISSSSSLK